MKRGTIVIVIMLVVAVGAAALSVWYHYRNQRRPQEFWGSATAQLIDRGEQVELLRLGEARPDIALDDDLLEEPEAAEEEPREADAAPLPKAVEFNQTPWLVAESKEGAQAQGLANLRRALVLDATFDWSQPSAAEEPDWQFAFSTSDGRDWATVLFDFETRQVALSGGRKTARLMPAANEDFQRFFAEQFEADEDPRPEKAEEDASATKQEHEEDAESRRDEPDRSAQPDG